MSRVEGLRTIRIAERPSLVWVEVATDEGLTGLGTALLPDVARRSDARLRETCRS